MHKDTCTSAVLKHKFHKLPTICYLRLQCNGPCFAKLVLPALLTVNFECARKKCKQNVRLNIYTGLYWPTGTNQMCFSQPDLSDIVLLSHYQINTTYKYICSTPKIAWQSIAFSQHALWLLKSNLLPYYCCCIVLYCYSFVFSCLFVFSCFLLCHLQILYRCFHSTASYHSCTEYASSLITLSCLSFWVQALRFNMRLNVK